MNASAITIRVADLIKNPNSPMSNELERSKQEAAKIESSKIQHSSETNTNTKNYEVSSEEMLTLSPLAQKILEEGSSYQSNWEKNRNENLQRIQSLVQEKQYSLHPEIIDNIAQKIVAMLP